MSSQSTMPPRSASAATTSKRHSLNLNVTLGPRPLHLVDGNTPLPANSVITQLPSPPPTSSTSPFAKPNIRRHSSISYRSSNQIESSRSPSSSPQPNLLLNSSSSHTTSPEERGEQDAQERPPLTLVEKHSDLLHFIAQKESKCLELRSQLAVLETEILQLKRKWERIVNRGFLDNPPASASTSQANSAVIEGFVEGVQGVSRFIAAGLAIGEQIHSLPPPSSAPRSLRPAHSSSQSNPSASTYTTKPTRLSRSSPSSITIDTKTAGESEPTRILMVHDTGATPTMSPNPAFEHQRQQQQQQQWQPDSQPVLEVPLLNASKLYRRKSVEVHSRVLIPSEGPPPTSSQPESTLEVTDATRKEALRAKRATLHGTNFPPVSSIPGLAALTVGPASPVPSWVESIGKKWEELQGSTFSKKQKRASTILSDVSQSIVSALSSPSTLMSTSSPPRPSYFDPSVPSVEPQYPFNRATGTSLDNSDILASPRTMVAPKPCPDTSTTLVPANKKTKPGAKDEDEWNW